VNNNKMIAAASFLSSTLMLSPISFAEVSLFPDHVYLSTSYTSNTDDQSEKLMGQLGVPIELAVYAVEDIAVQPATKEARTEGLQADTAKSITEEPETKYLAINVTNTEPATSELSDSAPLELEVLEADPSERGLSEVETPERQGLFKRMGNSFSNLFSRDQVSDSPGPVLAKADVDVEAEVKVEANEVNTAKEDAQIAVVEEISDEKSATPAERVKPEQEPAEVMVAETKKITKHKDDKPEFLNRMGKSGSNVLSADNRKEENNAMNGKVDIATESLGAASDMFISANDGAVVLSVSKDRLPLKDFVKLVAIRNDRIAYQKTEWAIAKSGVDSVSGIYEPELTASYQYTDSDTPNTTEEEFRRSFAPTFIERNHDYSLAVESVVPTGGRVRVSYTFRDIENNIQPEPIRGEEEKNYFGLSLTQPLLRGAGWRSVESPLKVARKDQGIAKETFRQSLFQTISDAVSVYWDVYMAEKRKELRDRSVEIAQDVLVDEKERARFGRSSQANILDAESALAQRRVQLLAAEQSLFAVTGQLRNYIAGMPRDKKIKVDVSGMNEPGSVSFDRASMLANAYLYRPEYVAGLLRAEREDVRIQFAKNNKLPQLDLVASYGLNGLAESFGESWDDVWDGDHESVYVGVEYRMALQGNKRGKGELSAARLRKHQALLEIKAAEIAIHNSIDTAINNLESARMQVSELTGVVETNQKLLDFELAKFEAGQSNSRDLFEIEERLNRVLELELESKVNLQKAIVGAALSEGTLLQNFELEK
jgi:outer membrane protein